MSNVNWLKASGGGGCRKCNDGASYCANSCNRTVIFVVDQSKGTETIHLSPTRISMMMTLI